MKLTAQIKLLPSTEQVALLKETLERANAACNHISEYAWTKRQFGKYPLQEALYYRLREDFGLCAQMVIRCLGKVADAYKLDSQTHRTFTPHRSIPSHHRILGHRQ